MDAKFNVFSLMVKQLVCLWCVWRMNWIKKMARKSWKTAKKAIYFSKYSKVSRKLLNISKNIWIFVSRPKPRTAVSSFFGLVSAVYQAKKKRSASVRANCSIEQGIHQHSSLCQWRYVTIFELVSQFFFWSEEHTSEIQSGQNIVCRFSL